MNPSTSKGPVRLRDFAENEFDSILEEPEPENLPPRANELHPDNIVDLPDLLHSSDEEEWEGYEFGQIFVPEEETNPTVLPGNILDFFSDFFIEIF